MTLIGNYENGLWMLWRNSCLQISNTSFKCLLFLKLSSSLTCISPLTADKIHQHLSRSHLSQRFIDTILSLGNDLSLPQMMCDATLRNPHVHPLQMSTSCIQVLFTSSETRQSNIRCSLGFPLISKQLHSLIISQL